jgi:hypothetical protein
VRLSLTPGDVRFAAPGESVRLVVWADDNNGTHRNVTSDVRWTIERPDVASIDGGMLTGRAYGPTTFRGEYQEMTVGPGSARVTVPSELLVPLRGVVRDQYGRALPAVQIVGAGVETLGGSTDASGAFDLGPTYGPVRLSLS